MTDLFRLPTEAELGDLITKVSIAGALANLADGAKSKRTALLRLVAVCVAVLDAEKAETAQLTAMIDHTLTLYRQHEHDDADAMNTLAEVILSDAVQAKLETDPALRAAFNDIQEKMQAAMQGVKEGRYPSFDVAMEAITGQKPQPLTEEDHKNIAEFENEWGTHTKQ